MSQGERPSGVSAHPPASADSPPLQPPNQRNGEAAAWPDWQALFPALSASQQHELLELAARQGFLHARQLPATDQPADRGRALFSALLQESPHDLLGPFHCEPIVPLDAELDAWQRNAVSKAVHTPDVCLIQGEAGTGKTRVIAEIIRQAARRRQRVLLTAPSAAVVDVALERLADDSAVLALRCLGRDERIEDLPPVSAGRTIANCRRRLLETVAAHASRVLEEIPGRIARARNDLDVLERLRPLIERRQQLEAASVATCRVADSGDDDFRREIAAAQEEHAAKLDRLDVAVTAATVELQKAQKQITELEARLGASEQSGRSWLAKLFHFSSARAAAEAPQCRAQLEELRRAEGQAKQKVEHSVLQRQQVVSQWEIERQRRLDGDAARRRAEGEYRRAELAAQLAELESQIEVHRSNLSNRAVLAGSAASEAVAQCRDAVRHMIEQAEGEEAFARRWRDYLAANAADLPGRLLQCVNLVAAPLAALSTDDTLAELTRDAPFDLLIIDEAHCVSEPELHAALRRGRRWALVAEPANESAASDPGHEERQRPSPGRNGRRHVRTAPPRWRPWPRLWQQLHVESWQVEGTRLCARLLPLTGVQRRKLESEAVADTPDVELRIWTPPQGSPTLAEVLFPAAMPIERALAFLHRELGELPAGAGPICWDDVSGRLACRLLDAPGQEIELGPGLRARLAAHPSGWRLAGVEFDIAAGWSRDSAEAWAHQALRFADGGRTAMLPTAYRAVPAVARFVASLGSAAVDRPIACTSVPAVEFIPVPALTNEPQARRRGDVGVTSQQRRLPPLRGGAGYETDLVDSRQRDNLPPDLRSLVPQRGFVNLTEAQAIIRLLENLIDDLPANPAERPASIAVLPLYAAQAELIRHLIRQSATLASSAIPLWIEAAGRFRQREADLVVVGLTRSHSHRAASYGDEPGALALAISRARRRLVLVGDPGTLARRAQWEGPLDHLDETAASGERAWITALVRQLQGQGASTIHLREGPP